VSSRPGSQSDPEPATHGGPGWQPRQRTHRADLQSGLIWRACGSCSEVDDLLEVTLAWPGPPPPPGHDPNDHLMLEWPDSQRLQGQATAIGKFYEGLGITVHWASSPPNLPNFLFQRDLFFMTPEGAVLARPGSEQRAAEARVMANLLSGLGVPILATPRGNAVFEGADALWLNSSTVLIGVGLRTNRAGADLVAHLLAGMNVTSIPIDLPNGVQHLLGIVNFVDRDLAAIRLEKASAQLLSVLRETGIKTIPCPPGEETSQRLGMNFVAFAPRHVVMPAGCPHLKKDLHAAGVVVHELEIDEYCKAAGGLGCLTGILRRRADSLPNLNSRNGTHGNTNPGMQE
jgi:N-dimethylarginine dimethylaminohydrolase